MLNGADGLGQIAAGLVGQGLTIFESVKSNISAGDEAEDEDQPPELEGDTTHGTPPTRPA